MGERGSTLRPTRRIAPCGPAAPEDLPVTRSRTSAAAGILLVASTVLVGCFGKTPATHVWTLRAPARESGAAHGHAQDGSGASRGPL